jgi:hypothetical protein
MASPDPSLLMLLGQINAKAPNRRKDSDGWIGDAAHQATNSAHNPEYPAPPGNPAGEVDARDFTHDPANGCDIGEIFDSIRLSRDDRVWFFIFNKRCFSSYSTSTRRAWEWGPYYGENDHSKHGHGEVKDTNRSTRPWTITGGAVTPAEEKEVLAAARAVTRWANGALTGAPLAWQQRADAVNEGVAELLRRAGAGPSASDVAEALLPALLVAVRAALITEGGITEQQAEAACTRALSRLSLTVRPGGDTP